MERGSGSIGFVTCIALVGWLNSTIGGTLGPYFLIEINN